MHVHCTEQASRTEFGKLFHIFTIRAEKKCLRLIKNTFEYIDSCSIEIIILQKWKSSKNTVIYAMNKQKFVIPSGIGLAAVLRVGLLCCLCCFLLYLFTFEGCLCLEESWNKFCLNETSDELLECLTKTPIIYGTRKINLWDFAYLFIDSLTHQWLHLEVSF